MQRQRYFSFIAVFIAAFIFLIAPPLFLSSNGNENFTEWKFPFSRLAMCLVSAVLFFVCRNYFFIGKSRKISESKKITHIMNSSYFLVCFGFLWMTSAALQIFAGVFGKSAMQSVAKPIGLGWIFCALNFLFSAISEEILYRFFLPDGLNLISEAVRNARIKSVLRIFSDFFSALIFAFSHRYLGFFSVVNAFFAHGILRFCYNKTGRIELNFILHFLYNFFSLIVMVFA